MMIKEEKARLKAERKNARKSGGLKKAQEGPRPGFSILLRWAVRICMGITAAVLLFIVGYILIKAFRT